MSRATNKSTSRSCSRLAWASRFSIAAMYSSLLGMGVPPLKCGVDFMDPVARLLISFLLSSLLIMALPLLVAFFRSRNDKVLERREKVMACFINFFVWIVIGLFLRTTSTLPAAFWSFVAYFLMTPVYEHTPSKH